MQIIHFHQQRQHSTPSDQLKSILTAREGCIWIDLHLDNPVEMEILKAHFEFHPLTLEDVQKQGQRPKAEEYADYLFLTLSPLTIQEGGEFQFRELNVFVGEHYVVTAHMGEEPIISELKRRLEHKRAAFPFSATYLVYVITDVVLDSYLPTLEFIESQIDRLGNEALNKPTPSTLNQIFDLKKHVNEFWWVAYPTQEILSVLTSHETLFTEERSQYYLRDLTDHLARILNSLQVDRDTVTSLINIYMSSVSNQLNYAVGRLTLLTIIVGIVAVFTGFYGMNFERTFPPFSAPWGVPFVLFMIALTTSAAFAFLRWKRWIQ